MNMMLKAMMIKMGLKESDFALYEQVEKATWKDSKGRTLHPADFEDEHLLNTIGYLTERAERLNKAKNIIKDIAKEGIFPVVANDVDMVAELKKNPVYVALILEANNRGLI